MSEARQGKSSSPVLTSSLLLGMVALVLALLVQAPASLLQRTIPVVSGFSVSGWGGTIWNGQLAWSQGDARGLLGWHVRPLALLRARVAADVHAQGSVPLSGSVVTGWHHLELQQLQGELPVAMLQPILPPDWQLPGVLQAQRLNVIRSGLKSGAWVSADGSLAWGGGALQFGFNGQVQQAVLPPVLITPRVEGDTLVLVLDEAAGHLGLAQVRIGADGRVETRLRERLLRYNPSYRSSGGDPDAIVATSRPAP